MKNKFIASAATAATILCATMAQAQTNFQWVAGANGDWETNTNWSPAVPEGQIIGNGQTLAAAPTIYDRVTIAAPYTVTRNGNIFFRTDVTSDPRKATFDAITLSGGATLNVNGMLTVTTSSANYVRNVLIETGSTLNATEIRTGTQNNTFNQSTWNIFGNVTAGSFKGIQGSASSTTAGRGFVLNVNGGTLSVTNSFVWGFESNPANTARVGNINILNNGVVDIGTMSNDWLLSSGNFVNFIDGTGSLRFGNSGWNLEAVHSLISNQYIRVTATDMALQVESVGDAWLVTAVAIPEASTSVSIILLASLGSVALSRRVHRLKRR